MEKASLRSQAVSKELEEIKERASGCLHEGEQELDQLMAVHRHSRSGRAAKDGRNRMGLRS